MGAVVRGWSVEHRPGSLWFYTPRWMNLKMHTHNMEIIVFTSTRLLDINNICRNYYTVSIKYMLNYHQL